MNLSCRLEVDLFEEGMTRNERNILTDEFGDLVEIFHFFLITKHDCIALETSSSGSPDTMDVHFRF